MKIIFLILLLPLASIISTSISYEAPFNDIQKLQAGKNLSIRLELSSAGRDHISIEDLDNRLELPSVKDDRISTKDLDKRFFSATAFKATGLAIAYTSEILVFFVALCLILPFFGHLTHLEIPNEQRPQLIILCLPIVWAFTSLFGVELAESNKLGIIMNGIEETYADLAVWMFFSLLMANLTNNAPNGDIDGLLRQVEIHIFYQPPISECPKWSRFLQRCTWQSCLVCFTGSFILMLLDVYPVLPSWVPMVLTCMFAISATVSLFALIIFFKECMKHLSLINLIEKLACIKVAVFVQFWQEIVFNCLKYFGIVFPFQNELPYTLLILEMCALAMAQCHYYSAASYHGYAPLPAESEDLEAHRE